MRTYTKADLEQIVMTQLENLNAMHDLLSIMKSSFKCHTTPLQPTIPIPTHQISVHIYTKRDFY